MSSTIYKQYYSIFYSILYKHLKYIISRLFILKDFTNKHTVFTPSETISLMKIFDEIALSLSNGYRQKIFGFITNHIKPNSQLFVKTLFDKNCLAKPLFVCIFPLTLGGITSKSLTKYTWLFDTHHIIDSHHVFFKYFYNNIFKSFTGVNDKYSLSAETCLDIDTLLFNCLQVIKKYKKYFITNKTKNKIKNKIKTKTKTKSKTKSKTKTKSKYNNKSK